MSSFIEFLGQSTLREKHSLGMLQKSIERRLLGPYRSERGMEKIT
jgi:hypothetical protein